MYKQIILIIIYNKITSLNEKFSELVLKYPSLKRKYCDYWVSNTHSLTSNLRYSISNGFSIYF